MSKAALTLAGGWSSSFTFVTAKNKEEEVRQGRNLYFGAVCQVGELAALSTVVRGFIREIPVPYARIPLELVNESLPLLGLGLCPAFAAIEQGHYKGLVNGVASISPTVGGALPDNLSLHATQRYTWIAQNVGKICQIGMMVSTVALPILGNTPLAFAMMTPVIYQNLDSRGWVPRRVSRLMESVMPTVANAFMVVEGGGVLKALSLAQLAGSSPFLNRKMQRKFDAILSKILPDGGPTLRELEGVCRPNFSLSYRDIMEILNGEGYQFVINPAHYTEWPSLQKPLPEERDFNHLRTLFLQVDWEKEALHIRRKLKDDERFIDFLKSEFSDFSNGKKSFDSCLSDLAKKNTTTEEKYLADQVKKQMEELVQVLLGKKRVKGSQVHLAEAMQDIAKIIPYLRSLKSEIEKVDILLKLAIEGGEYCALGIKRAAAEICSVLLQCSDQADHSQMTSYETKIKENLRLVRVKLLDASFLKLIEILAGLAKGKGGRNVNLKAETTDPHAVAFAQDVHSEELLKRILALGFVPLSPSERNTFTVPEIYIWKHHIFTYSLIRQQLYRQYEEQMETVISENGELHFSQYMVQRIHANPKLSEKEREAIIECYTESNGGRWSVRECNHRFHRLMFVMLGILRPKQLDSEEWEFVEHSEENNEEKVHDLEEEWEMVENPEGKPDNLAEDWEMVES